MSRLGQLGIAWVVVYVFYGVANFGLTLDYWEPFNEDLLMLATFWSLGIVFAFPTFNWLKVHWIKFTNKSAANDEHKQLLRTKELFDAEILTQEEYDSRIAKIKSP
jgi:hypothetical protein